MGIEVDLTEGLIACGIGILFLHPRCGAVSGHNGDLMQTIGGGDDTGASTDEVGLVQRLYEGMLELIGNEVATLAVGADL